MDINELTSKIIKAAMTVHNTIGPGLLESVYQECLRIELEEMNLHVQKEVLVPVIYKGREITQDGFRIDLLVEDTAVVELKSVEEVKPVHKKQLLTYLRLTGKTVGLLINFNEAMLKNGITRVVNNVPHDAEVKFYPQGVRVCRYESFSHSSKETSPLCELCASNDRKEWARGKVVMNLLLYSTGAFIRSYLWLNKKAL